MSTALLEGLRDLVAPLATGKASLHQLSDTPDVQWALAFNRGPTDPLGRWGQGVLTLITRGERGNPHITDGYADPVVRRLLAVEGVSFGPVTVNLVEHRGGPSGPDANKRTIRVDTFFLDLDYQA